ncbi:neuromedin-U isoform X2 [Gouania willdenowi]|uniref:neuromedin-U isoform X2 n=1 Tax=Gouania willdenowi TaxID=441366 RepID=UPI0010553B84|nr:neuromedin-U isoform X2 [Gouania willdenowi]
MSVHRQPVEHGALSAALSFSSTMSPLSTASFTLTALLILTTTLCQSAPVDLQQDTTQKQTLNQSAGPRAYAMCSSYLSAQRKLWTSDILGELCVMILVQKSKIPGLQPLLHRLSQLHTRQEREILMQAEIHRPAGIQSRGFFLYRPRNGRRYIEQQ